MRSSRARSLADAPSEKAYLAEELVYTQSAVTDCIARLRNDVMKYADPRPLVQKHPWATMGAAIAAGFVAAAVVTPAKGESFSEKLSHLKPEPKETKTEVAESSIRSMIITFVVTTLMNFAKEAFTQWTSAAAPADGARPDEHAYPPFSEVGEDSGV